GRVRLEDILPPAGENAAGGAHTVDLLVIVEVGLLFEGRAHDDALRRLVREQDAPVDGPAAGEVLHAEGQQPPLRRVEEGDGVAAAGDGDVPARAALRQAAPA